MRRVGSSVWFSSVAASLVIAGCGEPPGDVETSDEEVVYGTDNRVDVPSASAAEQGAAASVAAQVDDSEVSCSGGTCDLDMISYDYWFQPYGLCSTEPFNDQYTVGGCTAFLVDEDKVATAGHCVSTSTCSRTNYVFGYQMPDADGVVTGGDPDFGTLEVPDDDVYSCASIIKRVQTSTTDYAVVQLDRAVTGRTPLCFRRSGKVANGTSLTLIGTPYGLPLKVAGGATVKAVKNSYFDANLDSYGGSSGSPVFNASTMSVEGILVRGQTDFKYDAAGHCYKSNTCSDATGCSNKWESATHTKYLNTYVPTGTCYTP